jgi:hypothetical protein
MSLLVFQPHRLVIPYVPTFGNAGTAGPNTSTHTYGSYTFPTGKVLVAVWEACQAGQSISTVTVKGTSATRLATGVAITDSDLSFWEATVTSGSGNIVCTSTSGNFTRGAAAWWEVTGGSYVGSATIGVITENPLDLSINTNAGDAAFFCTVDFANSATWTATGYTENFDTIVETHSWHGGLKTNCAGGAPESFTATPSTGTNYGGLAVNYRAD